MSTGDGMTDQYWLAKGSHTTPDEGRCAMEWVAHIAGEPHSDKPVCVAPSLRTFGIGLNDAMGDDERQKLRPLLARCIGTAGDGREDERFFLLMDWLIRGYAPTWLALVPALRGHADALRALPPVLTLEDVQNGTRLLDAARDAAWAAARAAAGGAAGGAAWAAAGGAAWDAAGGAAGGALQPTVLELRASAVRLFDRMLPTVPLAVPAAEDRIVRELTKTA